MTFLRGGAPRAALPVLACLTTISPALAQAPPGRTTTLDEISVAGASGFNRRETAGSLTVPSVAAQEAAVKSTVGSVAFVDAAAYQNTYANTVRDVLKDVPGVFVQTRYGQEMRLSIRGSGIARGFTCAVSSCCRMAFRLILPTARRLLPDRPTGLTLGRGVQGGNALSFGATTLGGAVNFVTPTAYTAGAQHPPLRGRQFSTRSARASRPRASPVQLMS